MWIKQYVSILLLAALSVAVILLVRHGISFTDIMAVGTSLAYQVIAIPREIVRNYHLEKVTKMSYGIAALGAASYCSNTVRAVLQPDWPDVAGRWWGTVGSLIVIGQIIAYDRIRVSYLYPFVVTANPLGHISSPFCPTCRKGYPSLNWPRKCKLCQGNIHLVADANPTSPLNDGEDRPVGVCDRCECHIAISTVKPLQLSEGVYWIQRKPNRRWRRVRRSTYLKHLLHNRTSPSASGVQYFRRDDGMTGVIIKGNVKPSRRASIKELYRYTV